MRRRSTVPTWMTRRHRCFIAADRRLLDPPGWPAQARVIAVLSPCERDGPGSACPREAWYRSECLKRAARAGRGRFPSGCPRGDIHRGAGWDQRCGSVVPWAILLVRSCWPTGGWASCWPRPLSWPVSTGPCCQRREPEPPAGRHCLETAPDCGSRRTRRCRKGTRCRGGSGPGRWAAGPASGPRHDPTGRLPSRCQPQAARTSALPRRLRPPGQLRVGTGSDVAVSARAPCRGDPRRQHSLAPDGDAPPRERPDGYLAGRGRAAVTEL
jgi:hypothetical protein